MRHRDHTGVERYAALPRPEGREAAVQALVAHGFPGRRDEDWYYTPTKRLLEQAFTPVIGTPRDPEVELPEGERLVFVDGRFHEGLSTVHQVLADDAPAEGLLDEPTGFDALNTALWRTGARLSLSGEHDGPVHLVHVSTGDHRLAAVRHRIELAAGAEVQLVEHHLGTGGEALVTTVTELSLGEGATAHHLLLQAADEASSHVHTVRVQCDAGSAYHATSVQRGAGLARVALHVELAGEQASTTLSGLALGRGSRHVDHHLLVDHAVPSCRSEQDVRSVLDDTSRSVFTGKVVVRVDAQQTHSEQSNHNLLLSDDAVAHTRPQLEIYADDVSCAHGATVGSIDDESLFYLRQRGLSAVEARGLLMEGFARAVLDGLPEGLHALAESHVAAWLEAR
jgi:Fe-S cluster assembly protein SufD